MMARVAGGLCAGVIMLLLPPLAMPPPAAADAPTRAELKRQRDAAQQTVDALGRQAEQEVETILQGVERDVEAARRDLERKVRSWTEDPRDATVADLQRGMREALDIARAQGLDVAAVTRIYELTKKIIRTADFEFPGRRQRGAFTNDLPGRVEETFMWAVGDQREIAKAAAEHTRFRLGLLKRATIAYIRALVASREPVPECRPGRGRPAQVGGQAITLLDCADPVVENLRRYLDAVRTIQSADTDALVAQAEELVLQQQLVSDLAAALPFINDFLDVYKVFSGEDILTGKQLDPVERAVTGFFVALPYSAPLVDQVAKRSPRAALAKDTINLYLQEAEIFVSDLARSGSRQAREGAAAMLETLATRFGTTWPRLQAVARAIKPASYRLDPARLQVIRQLRDAAQDRIYIMDLPVDVRRRIVAESAEHLRLVLDAVQGSLDDRIAASGLLPEHARAIAEVARRRKQVYVFRGVNQSAARRMADDWSTKGMGIKAKSAEAGPIAGAIPLSQELNKNGSSLAASRRQLEQALRAGAPESELARLRAEVGGLEKAVAEGREIIEKCFKETPPCATKVEYPVTYKGASQPLLWAQEIGSGEPVFVVRDAGRWVDPETGRAVQVAGQPEKVLILGDPATGRPLTADLDFLAFGERGRHTQPTFSKSTGYVTRAQEEILRDVNQSVRDRGYRGGNLVHHGAETNYLHSPGVEARTTTSYVLTAMDETGQIVRIPSCDAACMRRWCEVTRRCDPGTVIIDRDRLVKDYFHHKRTQQLNLDPNDRWGWGPYNVLGGWLPQVDPAKALDKARRLRAAGGAP